MPLRDIIKDPRIKETNAKVNGVQYAYLNCMPLTHENKGSIFLLHGWPDLPLGWHNQITLFLDMGFRVIVPAMMGYAGSDAPSELSYYTFKRAAYDIQELARQLGLKQIILGGHDWGGIIVWRIVLFCPGLVSHVFSVCSPYIPPQKTYTPVKEVVETKLPFFRYQLQLMVTEVQENVKTLEQMKQFFKAMYGGRGPNGEDGFDPNKGILIENLPKLGNSPLLKPEVLDYYAESYMGNGIGPTCNWYRSSELEFQEDQILEEIQITIPALFIAATRDNVLRPELAVGMPSVIPNLTSKEVAASHWALIERPDAVNALLKDWFETVVLKDRPRL